MMLDDPHAHTPSSAPFVLCYAQPRNAEPREFPAGKLLVGLGVAMAVVIMFANMPRTPINSRATRCNYDLMSLASAVEMFKIDTGQYPTAAQRLDVLVLANAAVKGWNGPYIQSLPTDPWGRAYIYTAPTSTAPKPAITSLGEDGVISGDDISAP